MLQGRGEEMKRQVPPTRAAPVIAIEVCLKLFEPPANPRLLSPKRDRDSRLHSRGLCGFSSHTSHATAAPGAQLCNPRRLYGKLPELAQIEHAGFDQLAVRDETVVSATLTVAQHL